MKRAASVLAAFGSLLTALPAGACPTLTIESDERALIPMVEAAFATRADIDRCARVVLTSHGKKITIAVTLPDGRTAVRTVSRREDLVGALEALLRIPAEEVDLASDETVLEVPPLPAAASAMLFTRPEERDALATSPAPQRSHLAAELGVGTGARVGDRPSIGIGAIFLLDVQSWLVGAEGRLHRYTTSEETQATGAASIAAIGGRRLRFDTMSLDLFTGAGMRTEKDQADVPYRVRLERVPPPPGSGPVLDLQTDRNAPEVVFGARLNFRARSIFRTFVSLDGTVGTSWSFGLTLGAAVGS